MHKEPKRWTHACPPCAAAGMERASGLLVQLHGHSTAWDATRVLASQLGKDDPGQLAACCATVPGLRAALHAMRERLAAEEAAGPPQRPPEPSSGRAPPMPQELLAVLPDCWLFAPIKARGGALCARTAGSCCSC